MKFNKLNWLFFLLLLIPAFFVFKIFFTSSTLVSGDAPYLYSQTLKELLTLPNLWTTRGNALGGINHFIWISPLMYIYAVLGVHLHLSNALILKLLFYIPAISLSIISSYFFAKQITRSKLSHFLIPLIYTLNTYFILLIDGGQVGVALAYGMFPLSVLFLKKFVETRISRKNLLVPLFFSVLLTLIDFRVSLIAFLTVFIWILLTAKRNIGKLFFLAILVTAFNIFWIFPLTHVQGLNTSLENTNLKQISISDSLFLFQPHWPQNQFGQLNTIPKYFILVPFLLLLPLFFKRTKTILTYYLLFLCFAFLAKGSTAPFGFIYDFLVTKIPFGFVFRDSSKFFIPLFLFAGVLLSESVEIIITKIKNKNIKNLVLPFFYLYVLLLIHQAISGSLTGVLKYKEISEDEITINTNLQNTTAFSRAAWFPSQTPYSYTTQNSQSLDAKALLNLRPLASLNIGSEDFNYINNPNFSKWYQVFGLKDLIVQEPRYGLSPKQNLEWRNLISQITKNDQVTNSQKYSQFLTYEVAGKPQELYSATKALLVVGPDDIYYAKTQPDFIKTPYLFLEDGKFDPTLLEHIASESANLVLNHKDKTDLALSLLQKYFLAPDTAIQSQWARYSSAEYLTWKYELFMRGIDTHEFDYTKGVAFSTQNNEKMNFRINVRASGDYNLAVRAMSKDQTSNIKILLDDHEFSFTSPKKDLFTWFLSPKLYLSPGNHEVQIVNLSGLNVVNTLAILPDDAYQRASKTATDFINFFGSVDNEKIDSFATTSVNYTKTSETNFTLPGNPTGHWLILNANYDPQWQLKRGNEYQPPLPAYSALSVFYTDPKWTNLQIVFKPQETLLWGLYLEGIFILTFIIILLYVGSNTDEKRHT